MQILYHMRAFPSFIEDNIHINKQICIAVPICQEMLDKELVKNIIHKMENLYIL